MTPASAVQVKSQGHSQLRMTRTKSPVYVVQVYACVERICQGRPGRQQLDCSAPDRDLRQTIIKCGRQIDMRGASGCSWSKGLSTISGWFVVICETET
jgi:hypothetical protein